MCFQIGPYLKPVPQSQVPRQPSQPRSSASTHNPGVQHTKVSKGVMCVGAFRGQAWAPCAYSHVDSQQQRASASSHCLNTQTHPASQLWAFSLLYGFLLYGSFWFFPSVWGMALGGAPNAGLGTCPFPKAYQPPLPAAYVYNVQSVPPFPQKKRAPCQ